MLFNNDLFLIPVCSGVLFMITGFVLLKFPPKKINRLYGYRTKSSMKNKERWDFAQWYSSKEMMKLASLLILSGCIGLVYQPNENIATFLGLGLMLLMVVVLIIRVESAIKKKFKLK